MRVFSILASLVGVFAAARAVGYVAGWDVARHRVETAWIWFAIVALVVAAMAAIRSPSVDRQGARLPLLAFVGFLALALVVYWPALGIGLLSDDFVLLKFAERGDLLPTEWPFVRVPPLLAWRAASSVLGDANVAVALHVCGIVLHGLNGYLVARVAQCVGVTATTAAVAGMLFVAYPTSVEATAWTSAMPDLVVTALTLSAVVAALSFESDRVGLIVSTIAVAVALISKENAVVIGALLIATAPLAPPARRRRLMLVGAIALAMAMIYIAWRASAGLMEDVARPFDRLAIKNFLTGPFAFLGLPVHHATLYGTRLFWTLWTASLALLLVSAPFYWRRDPRAARFALWAVIWIVIALAPTFGFFGANDDLQNTRYLYLPTVAWSIALAVHAVPSFAHGRLATAAHVVAAIVIVAFIITTRAHLEFWRQAAVRRNQIMTDVATLPASCDRVYIEGADNVGGAYVFRNGLAEALARAGRTPVTIAPYAESVARECRR